MNIQDSGMCSAGWWLVRMDLGVKIFFGISGFILSIPFFKYYWFDGRKVDTKAYFIRRLTRLEPPFLVTVTGFLLVHVFILNQDFIQMFPHYLATIFYLHTSIYNEYSVINPVTWSLETEVQFYLLIPLLAFLVLPIKKKGLVFFIGILITLASILMRGYVLREAPYGLLASIGGFMSHFMVGIFFAYLYLVKESWLKEKNMAWDLIGVVSFLAIFWFYKPQAGFLNQIMFNVSIFVLFISVFKGKILNQIMTFPFIYLVGGMCYSIYLLHLAFFGLLVKVFSKFIIFDSYSGNFIFYQILAFLLLLIISGIFFVYIEKPCMDKNWHQRFLRKKSIKS